MRNFVKYSPIPILHKGFIILLVLVTNAFSLHIKGVGKDRRLMLEPGKDFVEHNYIGYYMYNITNPDEVEIGSRPVFTEHGPYIYKETRRKFDIKSVSEDTLQYKLVRSYQFMPEMSEGHQETDLYNVINIPMMIMVNQLARKNLPTAFNNILVDELLEKGDTFIRRNEEFGNILYYGMNVSVYTEILADLLQGNVPPEFADGLFALIKNGNNSIEGEYIVQSKGPDAGTVLKFNNATQLKFWSGDFCNKIEGTDGYAFRAGLTDKSILPMFYSEACRSVYLTYSGTTKFQEIPVSKFSFPEDIFEDARVNEKNKCFCSPPIRPTNDTWSSCLKRGFIDYATCKQESPLLLSFPHFLYADKSYLNATVGLQPVPEMHKTEFLVEPKTGTIVDAVRRFQFNLKLRPLDNIDYLKNATNMIFPIFWTYRKMIIMNSTISDLKQELAQLSAQVSEKGNATDDIVRQTTTSSTSSVTSVKQLSVPTQTVKPNTLEKRFGVPAESEDLQDLNTSTGEPKRLPSSKSNLMLQSTVQNSACISSSLLSTVLLFSTTSIFLLPSRLLTS